MTDAQQAFAILMFFANAVASIFALIFALGYLSANQGHAAGYALAVLVFCGANSFALWLTLWFTRRR